MEISSLEINLLCRRINGEIEGYYLSGIYSMKDGVILRLNHERKSEKLIAISSFATWVSTKNMTLEQASPFVQRARDLIERDKIVSVEAMGNERIARFAFQSREGEMHNLYAEFFGQGNLILTSPEGEADVIVDALNLARYRHRSIQPGEKLLLPPERGENIRKVTETLLVRKRDEALRSGDREINALKWFGRNIGTSRKFVEEIFARSKIAPSSKVSELSTSQISTLARSIQSLIQDIESSNKGYLLLPRSPEVEKGGEPIEIDVCPIILEDWKNKERQGIAQIIEYQTINEALDEAEARMYVAERMRNLTKELSGKISELDSAIAKQEESIALSTTQAAELRGMGARLIRSTLHEVAEEDIAQLLEMGILEKDDSSRGLVQFSNEPRMYVSSMNPRSVASRLFDEAKRLEEKRRRIEEVRKDLEKQRDELRSQSLLQVQRQERRTQIERRTRLWYERYRWFVASDGRLVIGGRDSTSNSIIVNKYMERGDFVFHADLHGSPFFVLKKKDDLFEQSLSEEVALEVAQATVSFSRAWKDDLSSADAYWVNPEQVKKAAPSGQYLPRGSFFIEGKKNFVRHVKVELCMGLVSAEVMPGEEQSVRREVEEQELVVLCGPEKAVSKYALSNVKISPGKERGSAIAKRIKQRLLAGLKDPALKERAKRISLDDIIRVLPAGTYKISASP